jgi:MFS family permease
VRMGIGIGEASYAPAANSLIGDSVPGRIVGRGRWAFSCSVCRWGCCWRSSPSAAMVKAFDSWRAPFFIAAVPGLLLAIFMFFIKEPKRGAAETVQVSQEKVDKPIRRILAVPTFLWLVMAGLCFNFATYACNSFLVPMLQRYFLMPLQEAAVATGVIVGVTGLVGLTLGRLDC